MRVFLPRPLDESILALGDLVTLPAGTVLFACTAEARSSIGGDEEDLEYEALQDAVHVAFTQGPGRAVVLAGDVRDADLADGPQETGLFGLVAARETVLRAAAWHVSELEREAAEASDTEPALLWFDTSEAVRVLEVARRGPDALGSVD